MNNDIISVGSIALDTIITPATSAKEVLGGSLTHFSIIASFFKKTYVVGVVGSDFPDEYLEIFKRFNLDLSFLEKLEGRTFRWGGEYTKNMDHRSTLFTELGVFEHFNPNLMSCSIKEPILYLGNIQPNLQLKVLEQIHTPALVVSDTMNLWIDTARSELMNVIKKTTVFLLNEEEALMITKKQDIDEAALVLLNMGPQFIIIKCGSKGSFLFEPNKPPFYVPVFPVQDVVDPTGAGDSYAGGLVGFLAQHGTSKIQDAMMVGSAAASLCVESFSTAMVTSINKKQILERSKKIKRI